jgi:hypothetical protein
VMWCACGANAASEQGGAGCGCGVAVAGLGAVLFFCLVSVFDVVVGQNLNLGVVGGRGCHTLGSALCKRIVRVK